jgi:UDP-N-acetylmuramoyl-tripeptide--D-alanyl-D-alanine ligase
VTALWDCAAAEAATGGRSSLPWQASGVAIDTRGLAAGDLFIALRGPNRDGHDFVAPAFAAGAAAAMVARDVAGLDRAAPLLRVPDTLAGLAALGEAGRRRSRARILAVTGSVGKTGTKEALRLALAPSGRVAASSGSFNNHWGVPLSLARMAPASDYGIFELGMNAAGEIAALTRLVRPHVAIVTTVAPAHLGFFASVAAIADAKAEIFEGQVPGDIAILNRDNRHYARLAAAAGKAGVEIVAFGRHREAAVRLLACTLGPDGSWVTARLGARRLCYRLGVPGRHWVMNSLAVLAAVEAAGADVERAAAALGEFEVPPGRGRRHELDWRGGRLTLLDDSYNASPAAMRAALAVLGGIEPGPGGRRVAILGDMLELGSASARLHRALARPLAAARVDRAFLVGTAIAALHQALPAAQRGGLWPSADAAIPSLMEFLRAGDVVTVKGSHAGRVDRIVELLRAEAMHRDT